MLSSAPRQTGQRRQPATRIPTVCIVDPQVDDYQRWLAKAAAQGAKLQILATAEEALRLASTAAIGLWVVNTKLPGLSGYELCSMLKARMPASTVYLVTDEYSPKAERAAWMARATLFGCKAGHLELLDSWLATWSAEPAPRVAMRPAHTM